MTRSIRLAVLALVAAAVLALAGIAYAAYTTPSLKVTQVGSTTTISVRDLTKAFGSTRAVDGIVAAVMARGLAAANAGAAIVYDLRSSHVVPSRQGMHQPQLSCA